MFSYSLTKNVQFFDCSCHSHDVFVLYIAANVTMEMLMGLDFGQNGAGMENVLMWYFEKLMGYRLLNPCKIVYVYHNHCVPVKLVQYTR